MKRREPSEEEQALWRRAVADVKRVPAPRAPSPRAASAKKKPPSPKPPPPAGAKARRAHPIFGGGDPALDRSAGKRVAIERTLDLHGLTQAEAHRRLTRFLHSAADDGTRLALVITGKGGSGEGRGVLRARFLDWVEDAPLRALIARAAPARARDGGAGAFYVFLKRRGAGKSPRLQASPPRRN